MQRLIDANKLIAKWKPVVKRYEGDSKYWETAYILEGVIEDVENEPTVDAEPKHAYVIVDEDGNMECSNCGSSFCFDNYCGHCGAKLIGERKDEVKIEDIIYRQDAIELAMQYCPDDDGTCSKADEDMRNLLDELEDLPSAVVEAETVKHGHWARHLDTRFGRKLNDIIICSCCGIAFSTEYMIRRSYCPNCGAKMDEVEDAKTD